MKKVQKTKNFVDTQKKCEIGNKIKQEKKEKCCSEITMIPTIIFCI